MLGGSITGLGQFDAALAQIRAAGRVDLKPLADSIAEIIRADNREGLLNGIDATGAAMTPLKASTRRRRGRDDGPPGVPDGGASSLIRDYRVSVNFAASGLEIVAGWDGETARKARLFHEGSVYQVPRPIVGLRPGTRDKIQAALEAFARQVSGR